ncbi:enamine deaminase RidA (YjgF/YER057c/UK114 family) [Prauserella sediminis]|uniref:Enamine deaminase RidA (YjgF/YER057c/UK114 family) n=1 Tax=Prauserella sediminis TaxID=577680 RepID=A0A839XPA1_9PSEU|nr:RidA family protein [Prauserella sediminis]MBB3664507.1 enamine deaminase RidA (YjgF/YER057c/UK114 family) [Prauserella sediminis]
MSKHAPYNPAAIAAPIGKFSHVAIAPAGAATAYVSGQIGVDTDGKIVSYSCYEQTKQTFSNLEAVLDDLGVEPSAIVKMLTLVVGDDGFADFARARDEIYARWFPTGVYPAHSAATVTALAHPDLRVEIEAVVVVPS